MLDSPFCVFEISYHLIIENGDVTLTTVGLISYRFPVSFKVFMHMHTSVVKNIDISISIDTEISERYQY